VGEGERKKREKTHLEAKWQSKRPHIIGIGSLLLLLNHENSLHGESVTNLTTTMELVRIVLDSLMRISNMVCCGTTLISMRIEWSSICVMVMNMGLFNRCQRTIRGKDGSQSICFFRRISIILQSIGLIVECDMLCLKQRVVRHNNNELNGGVSLRGNSVGLHIQ